MRSMQQLVATMTTGTKTKRDSGGGHFSVADIGRQTADSLPTANPTARVAGCTCSQAFRQAGQAADR